MNRNNLTIRKILFFTSLGISLILLCIAYFVNVYLKSSFSDHKLITKIEQIYSNELLMRKHEKDFVIYETINPDYYKTKSSSFLITIDNLLNTINKDITDLQLENRVGELGLNSEFENLKSLFNDYKLYMNDFSDAVFIKGFKDYGLVGKMRQQIHLLEELLNTDENRNLIFMNHMLMLRRHEKDYLLRKDIKYKDKFNDCLNGFYAQIRASKYNNNKQLIEYLENYNLLFDQVIAKDSQIGLNSEKGILNDLNHTVNKIEVELSHFRNVIEESASKQIRYAKIKLFAVFIILSLAIVLLMRWVNKYIIISINTLRDFINRLGKGELPQPIAVYNNDEIGQMKKSINILLDNLNNTREFAIAVGNGNFDKEINVFQNKGDLGGSLVEMRAKLIQIANDRKQTEEKDRVRMWVNDGKSKFASLLREQHDINNLMRLVLVEIVKYINCHQGFVFLYDDESSKLILTAAYAYDRVKHLKKEIFPGEGLVGECFLEKDSIFLTEIPKTYNHIGTALGEAKPQSVLLVPLINKNIVVGVIELASYSIISSYQIEFVKLIASDICSTIIDVKNREQTNALLKKSENQAAILADNQQQLSQTIEELHAIRESYESKESEYVAEIGRLKKEKKQLQLLVN